MDKKLLFSLMLALTFTACAKAQSVTPPPSPATVTPPLSLASPAPQVATPAPTEAGTALPPVFTFTPPAQPAPGKPVTYAVIHVPANDVLNIRSGPGVENPVVGALQPAASGLVRTGVTSSVGDDLWVEIQNPGGGQGWVNADFLTEHVPSSAFCGDARVTALLRNLETAVKTTEGKLLKSLVSPAHGLDVVYIRFGTVANYSPEEAGWAFQSTYSVDWGLGAGSGKPVTGTFPEIILPALQDVFKNLTLTCNAIKLGGATYAVEWPSEYASINFYSLHNPGNDPSYAGMDWRTWLAGVEYVDGQPYLFALSHYQWEP